MKRALYISILVILLTACNIVSVLDPSSNPDITVLPTITQRPGDIGRVSIPHSRINYYEIYGSTEGELRKQLNAIGPVDDKGQRNDASTKWFVNWNWPGYGTDNCSLREAIIKVDVQVFFPHWTPVQAASPDLIAKWSRYTQVLALHEKGHVDNIIGNYMTVLAAIKGATCATAEAAAQAALVPIRQNDVNYDQATGHGATQGAIFP